MYNNNNNVNGDNLCIIIMISVVISCESDLNTNHNLMPQILKKLWNIFCCSSIVDLLDCEFDSPGFNKKFYDKVNGTHQAFCNIDLKK